MARRAKKKSARPIGSRRDFESASALAKSMSGDTERDSAAELRLKSLLRELDKYDGETEEDEADAAQEDYDSDSAGPRRRWSDDG